MMRNPRPKHEHKYKISGSLGWVDGGHREKSLCIFTDAGKKMILSYQAFDEEIEKFIEDLEYRTSKFGEGERATVWFASPHTPNSGMFCYKFFQVPYEIEKIVVHRKT